MIKLIIFDLDGTLVDSVPDIANALNYALTPYNFKKITSEEAKDLVGEGSTKLIEKIVGNNKDIAPAVLDTFFGYYSEHLADYTLPYPGVRSVLEELRACKKAVISNKREALSKKLLEKLRLLSYFDIVLGSDSVEEKKPSPKPVIQLLRLFSLKPENAVITGDSEYDVEAGKAAGVWTVAVTYGYRKRELLIKADMLIDRMEELVPAIKKLNCDISSAEHIKTAGGLLE
jgi:phosphoglycolate phosphatase